MYDPPALRQFAKHQCEEAAKVFAVGHFQMPAPAHPRRIASERMNFKASEIKLAHLPAFGLVALLVARERGIPSARDRPAGIERQLRRAPIAVHEAVDVTTVPRGGLLIEHRAHGRFFRTLRYRAD